MASATELRPKEGSVASPSNVSNTAKGLVVCVFCGSSNGESPIHCEAARALATTFAAHKITLVYGGGKVGVMGELARTLVSIAGPSYVHGIIPAALIQFEREGRPGTASAFEVKDTAEENEHAYGKVTVVKDMHTRKQLMAQEVMDGGPGSGFVALSGGFGTMEELMEMTTWNQLGIHACPVVVFNINGYWNGLLDWVKRAVIEGFIAPGNAGILVEARNAGEVIEMLKGYKVSEGRFRLDWSQY